MSTPGAGRLWGVGLGPGDPELITLKAARLIGAAESKDALAALAEVDARLDIPFLTVRGRRGGSAMAASAINALAQEKE